MSVVPFRPFHACMNSNAVTLLSCGGAAAYIDEDEVLVDATELSSALDDGIATPSTDAAADPLGLGLSAAFTSNNHDASLFDTNRKVITILGIAIPSNSENGTGMEIQHKGNVIFLKSRMVEENERCYVTGMGQRFVY